MVDDRGSRTRWLGRCVVIYKCDEQICNLTAPWRFSREARTTTIKMEKALNYLHVIITGGVNLE